jgi:putative Mn2+ efflux pump MntP
MDYVTIVFIAIGLSMDSFAVSITNGLIIKNLKFGKAVEIAVFLSVIQALMPVIGWLLGFSFKNIIVSFDHWIAFLLLIIIGVKMIHDSFKSDKKEIINDLSKTALIGMGVATSIDALAVGITLGMISSKILISSLIIGLITFFFSMIGLRLGKFFKEGYSRIVEIFGGIILIIIGVKILIEHLYM